MGVTLDQLAKLADEERDQILEAQSPELLERIKDATAGRISGLESNLAFLTQQSSGQAEFDGHPVVSRLDGLATPEAKEGLRKSIGEFKKLLQAVSARIGTQD